MNPVAQSASAVLVGAGVRMTLQGRPRVQSRMNETFSQTCQRHNLITDCFCRSVAPDWGTVCPLCRMLSATQFPVKLCYAYLYDNFNKVWIHKQNKGYGGVILIVLRIILVSQHNTTFEAVSRMCTNHRSGKAQVISFMGFHCVLYLVTLFWYPPKRTECAALYPANLKESWCVGEILIADISESPVCRVSLRQGFNSESFICQ